MCPQSNNLYPLTVLLEKIRKADLAGAPGIVLIYRQQWHDNIKAARKSRNRRSKCSPQLCSKAGKWLPYIWVRRVGGLIKIKYFPRPQKALPSNEGCYVCDILATDWRMKRAPNHKGYFDDIPLPLADTL